MEEGEEVKRKEEEEEEACFLYPRKRECLRAVVTRSSDQRVTGGREGGRSGGVRERQGKEGREGGLVAGWLAG